MLFTRVIMLGLALACNLWHVSYLSMLIHVLLIWAYLILTFEGPWAPQRWLFPLTVSVAGGCMYFFATLHSLPYLWVTGYHGWCLIEAIHSLFFLIALCRAREFNEVEDAYDLAAWSNLFIQVIISYSLPVYWGEYGWWCLIFLMSLPGYRHMNFPCNPPPTDMGVPYVIHSRTLRHVALLDSCGIPHRIDYYSDGSYKEIW